MICIAICTAFVLRNGSRYRGRNIVVIMLRVDSCVQYEVDHVDRCYSSKLSRLCRPDRRAISFPGPSQVFHSFTREIPPRAFREWPIAIKRNETAEKVKGRKTEKKKRTKREAATNSTRETICEATRTREKERERRGERKSTRIVPALRPGF